MSKAERDEMKDGILHESVMGAFRYGLAQMAGVPETRITDDFMDSSFAEAVWARKGKRGSVPAEPRFG